MIKLVCIDVDGTLVGSTDEPTAEVWQATEKARKSGLVLATCTGRGAFGVTTEFSRRVNPVGWHIFHNGAAIMNVESGQIDAVEMQQDHIEYAEKVAKDNGWVIEFYAGNEYTVDSDEPFALRHARIMGVPHQRRDRSALTSPIVRMQIVTDESELPGVQEAFQLDGLELAPATAPSLPGDVFISIMSKGVSKATGIQKLCDIHGFDMAETMMIGDSLNDIAAIESVGHSVAMGNANPQIKRRAKYLVSHVDENGVVDALEIAQKRWRKVPNHLQDSPYLAVAKAQRPSRVPVWFMRQAGRSLPEYREVRGPGSINQAIADADRATEITLQPVRRYGVDAAILFSDIVTPVHGMGFGIDIKPGVGPVAENPIRSKQDLSRLDGFDPHTHTPYVLETVKNLVSELTIPLIGFAGAPFTVASYLIEGGPSKNKAATKAMMANEPELFAAILDRLADIAIASLSAQVEAGASAIQLFDSWAGCLSPQMYESHVFDASAKIMQAMEALGVPRTHFGINTGELLPLMRDVGAEIVGVDWLVPLDAARQRLGGRVALQGNLDPVLVAAGEKAATEATRAVIASNKGDHKWVFNLGHGVLPNTNPDVLAKVVEIVHSEAHLEWEKTYESQV